MEAFWAFPYLGVIAYAAFVLSLLFVSRPAYLAFRRRHSGFGVVFNSVTGIPEPLVSVRLRDLHGQVVGSAVTDRAGRYRLLAHRGEYLVDVTKEGFTFPSAYLGTGRRSTVYGNLLPAKHVIIKDHGVITKNIPIDPIAGRRRSRAFAWRPHIDTNVQVAAGTLGPLAAFALPWFLMRDSVAGWVVFVGYVGLSVKRLLSFKPAAPPFGTVRDAGQGTPVSRAVVRIFDAKNNKVLETQVTSEKGRYAFIVRKGAYYVLVQAEGYRTVRLNFPNVKKDGHLLVTDVRLHRLGSSEKDPLIEKYGGMSVPD
ncbi:carboxypeptidase-like regulatory domain-containing protein [Patescibacteria group bacterium]|nr:carboxypeptidase-like regulatory domain-containing protein [Patescibacteria group bacterium]MBU1448526.1 carboxypeptidase-like regulatory domain-containing protein [Patescibacteria group bacterium]MBU2613353.1 carboxypeptidase-like regulatory domain-containing protein [Patescibacteria group bacterium]